MPINLFFYSDAAFASPLPGVPPDSPEPGSGVAPGSGSGVTSEPPPESVPGSGVEVVPESVPVSPEGCEVLPVSVSSAGLDVGLLDFLDDEPDDEDGADV